MIVLIEKLQVVFADEPDSASQVDSIAHALGTKTPKEIKMHLSSQRSLEGEELINS